MRVKITKTLAELRSELNNATVATEDSIEQQEIMLCPEVELIEGDHEIKVSGEVDLGDLIKRKQKKFVKVKGSEKPQYTCVVCFKKLSNRSNLSTHFRIHTGIKPYECETCSRRFTDRNTLKRHRLTHSTERPYGCDLCSRTYTSKNSLNIHRKFHTMDRDYKNKKCDVTHDKLPSHIESHTSAVKVYYDECL